MAVSTSWKRSARFSGLRVSAEGDIVLGLSSTTKTCSSGLGNALGTYTPT